MYVTQYRYGWKCNSKKLLADKDVYHLFKIKIRSRHYFSLLRIINLLQFKPYLHQIRIAYFISGRRLITRVLNQLVVSVHFIQCYREKIHFIVP